MFYPPHQQHRGGTNYGSGTGSSAPLVPGAPRGGYRPGPLHVPVYNHAPYRPAGLVPLHQQVNPYGGPPPAAAPYRPPGAVPPPLGSATAASGLFHSGASAATAAQHQYQQGVIMQSEPLIPMSENLQQGGDSVQDLIGKQVLIVGDGDLSFAASFALKVLEPADLTATVYEQRKEFLRRYGEASEESGELNLKTLEMYDVPLLFGVDATDILKSLENTGEVSAADAMAGQYKRYDAVVWNFPYPIEWTKHNIELKCQELLYKFFVSAKKMIDDEGQIRIALIRGQYERWFIAHHAALAGLGLEQMIPFKKEDHKYYLNRYGDKREQTRDTRSSYIDKDPHYYVFRTTEVLEKLKKQKRMEKELAKRKAEMDAVKAQRETEKKREELKRVAEEKRKAYLAKQQAGAGGSTIAGSDERGNYGANTAPQRAIAKAASSSSTMGTRGDDADHGGQVAVVKWWEKPLPAIIPHPAGRPHTLQEYRAIKPKATMADLRQNQKNSLFYDKDGYVIYIKGRSKPAAATIKMAPRSAKQPAAGTGAGADPRPVLGQPPAGARTVSGAAIVAKASSSVVAAPAVDHESFDETDNLIDATLDMLTPSNEDGAGACDLAEALPTMSAAGIVPQLPNVGAGRSNKRPPAVAVQFSDISSEEPGLDHVEKPAKFAKTNPNAAAQRTRVNPPPAPQLLATGTSSATGFAPAGAAGRMPRSDAVTVAKKSVNPPPPANLMRVGGAGAGGRDTTSRSRPTSPVAQVMPVPPPRGQHASSGEPTGSSNNPRSAGAGPGDVHAPPDAGHLQKLNNENQNAIVTHKKPISANPDGMKEREQLLKKAREKSKALFLARAAAAAQQSKNVDRNTAGGASTSVNPPPPPAASITNKGRSSAGNSSAAAHHDARPAPPPPQGADARRARLLAKARALQDA
eukprot:CAMPEP_0178989636 /NCGR_PEP_ID=MMETSP0795-20121207/4490_1 /TAXON_ID=88552 /ORGANISM="Amoebophrya sp., Strain Ameob2" /LENGTH=916 /DNA_ID=CAMNT_0020681071 /DNA_START=314 /DNA_END=3064 /DNA_ORIENTATION=-